VCFLKNVARWVDVYMSTFAGKLLQFSYSYVPGCRSPSETTVGFAETLQFEHTFACWPYTLTHTTVCFLKNVARWVDVYMSTFAGKLLQFSYSYVPGCLSPALTTVGFAETLHFEHTFACWPFTLTHTTVCFLKIVARWVDVYMSAFAGKLLQFSYSFSTLCLSPALTTVGFSETLHFEPNFAYWPYTLTHTTVCFLKSVARWVDVYMSTSAGKLLQFSYSYVPGCRSPSETTVGFAETLHFEPNFASWP
jgi:hypothetical protein